MRRCSRRTAKLGQYLLGTGEIGAQKNSLLMMHELQCGTGEEMRVGLSTALLNSRLPIY
jgi:hypothetical protein